MTKSRDMGYVTPVAIGRSNRVVVDVDDVDLKRRLHAALAEDGWTMKEWFVSVAREYLDERLHGEQLPLAGMQVNERAARYRRRQSARGSPGGERSA